MTPETVLTVASQALSVTTMLAASLLLTALATGIFVGVLQAATQVNEMTLTFIPKLLTLVISLLIAGPWMLKLIIRFTQNLFTAIPGMVG